MVDAGLRREKVCVAVCTAARPIMLANCLRSLVAQRAGDGIEIILMVVDNNGTPDAWPIVDQMTASAPHPIVHVHQPKAGIPIARNTALDEAAKLGADWIVFIDDDEEAPADWVANLHAAAGQHGADVVQGGVLPVHRKPSLFVPPPRPLVYMEGAVPPFVSTANVIMRRPLVDAGGLTLRFDEEMRFTGGSDSEFFRRVRNAGFKIVATATAAVREHVPDERMTYAWRFSREARYGANNMRLELNEQRVSAYRHARLAVQSGWKALYCLGGFCLAPFFLVGGFRAFETRVIKLSSRLARSVGQLRAIFGIMPEPYRNIQGH